MDKVYPQGTTGNAQTDLMIRNLSNAVNEIVDLLNKATAQQKPSDSPGSMRVVKKGDNTYIVAVKSEDGWLVSDPLSSTGFRFQTKLD